MTHRATGLKNCRIIPALDELLATGEKFGCIYADVPWPFKNRSSRGAAENHYRTMTMQDIHMLPVTELTATNAHLHLWTPNALLPDALGVLSTWGFTYKTCFVWIKTGPPGLGNYWRNAHELLLLGVRGNLRFRDRSIKSWTLANRTTHSTKPDSIRELVEIVSPGPYLELFARRTVPGWVSFGNQVERTLF